MYYRENTFENKYSVSWQFETGAMKRFQAWKTESNLQHMVSPFKKHTQAIWHAAWGNVKTQNNIQLCLFIIWTPFGFSFPILINSEELVLYLFQISNFTVMRNTYSKQFILEIVWYARYQQDDKCCVCQPFHAQAVTHYDSWSSLSRKPSKISLLSARLKTQNSLLKYGWIYLQFQIVVLS